MQCGPNTRNRLKGIVSVKRLTTGVIAIGLLPAAAQRIRSTASGQGGQF
jgi:hypothetical protein